MPTLSTTPGKLQLNDTGSMPRGIAAFPLDQILAVATSPDGSVITGEDALTVMNRKLESAGILASGAADPVFANESALFYYQTTSETLFVRQASSYSELESTGLEDIIHFQGTIPVPDAAAKPIFINTADNTVRFKHNNNGIYSWIGPFRIGDNQVKILYADSAQRPTSPTVSWDGAEINITAGNPPWSEDVPANPTHSVWRLMLLLSATGNSVILGYTERVSDQGAEQVAYTPPITRGNIPASVDNVKEGLDVFHAYAGGGSGGGTDDQTAAEVSVASSGFDGNLSTDDDNVQKVAQKLDDLDIQGARQEFKFDPEGADDDLASAGATVTSDFTIESRLVNYSNNYQQVLSISAEADVNFQGITAGGAVPTVTVKFEVLTAAGAAFAEPIESVQVIRIPDANDVRTYFHVAGNLPIGTTGGKLRTTLVNRSRESENLGIGWVSVYKGVINADLNARNVIVDRSAFGDILPDTTDIVTVQDTLEELDTTPIQFQDFDSIAWPAEIEDDGVAVTRQFPIQRLIQEANNQPQLTFIVRGTYTVTGSVLGGSIASLSPTITLTSQDEHNANTTLFTHTETVDTSAGADPEVRPFEVRLPTDSTNLTFSVSHPANAGDVKLEITEHSFIVTQGIDASGFTERHRIANTETLSLQTLAKDIYDYIPSATPAAANVRLTNSQFLRSSDISGGLREDITQTTTLVDNPVNSQQAFVKTDYLLSGLFNPFQARRVLTHTPSSQPQTFRFSSSGTVVNSDAITLPTAVQDLSANLIVTVRMRVDSKDTTNSSYRGNVRLLDRAGTERAFGDDVAVSGSSTTGLSTGDYVVFQRVVPANQFPTDLGIRITRTSATGEMTFHPVELYAEKSNPGAGGGVGGGATAEWDLLWEQGPNPQDRRTATGAINLAAGRRFSDYRILEFWTDVGSAAREIDPFHISPQLFMQSHPGGVTQLISDNTWRGFRYVSDTQFYKVWSGGGIRKIYGLR